MEQVPWILTAVASSVIEEIYDIALRRTLAVFPKHRKQWSEWRYTPRIGARLARWLR